MKPSIPAFDVGGVLRDVQSRLGFLAQADRHVAELLDILRDTHRIMQKLERAVDRLETTAREYETKLADLEVSPKRLDRLEEAVLNIERATLSVEGALDALPRSMQQRIRNRRPTPQ